MERRREEGAAGAAERNPYAQFHELPVTPAGAAAAAVIGGGAVLPPYVIYGTDNQLLQVTLLPGERIQSGSPQHFVFCSDGVALEQLPRAGSGNWLARLFSGQGPDDVFINRTAELQFVGLSVAHAGKIVPVDVTRDGPALLVSNAAYLACRGNATHQRMTLQCAPQAEALPMQRISTLGAGGPATIFLQAGGTIVVKKLQAGESMRVSTACIAALTEGVTVHPPLPGAQVVALAGGGRAVYGEGGPWRSGWGAKMQNVCLVRGPGTVYVSNLPLPRVARHLQTARGGGGGAVEAREVKALRALFILWSIAILVAALHVSRVLELEAGPGF